MLPSQPGRFKISSVSALRGRSDRLASERHGPLKAVSFLARRLLQSFLVLLSILSSTFDASMKDAIVLDGWVSWLKALVFKLTKNGGKVMSVDRLRGDKNGHRHRKSKRHSMRWCSMSRMMQLCQKGALSNPPMRWCKKAAALFLVGLFLCAAIPENPRLNAPLSDF
jgi:hypothetical protein